MADALATIVETELDSSTKQDKVTENTDLNKVLASKRKSEVIVDVEAHIKDFRRANKYHFGNNYERFSEAYESFFADVIRPREMTDIIRESYDNRMDEIFEQTVDVYKTDKQFQELQNSIFEDIMTKAEGIKKERVDGKNYVARLISEYSKQM